MSHLGSENSPYLQQHVDNPVDWYPWSQSLFPRAQKENKLIFLSIGYSTCHWCHVMAHECFEDEEVAALLNADYLSIKVDREERPDIDQVYMEVCQRLTGSGGWPLTIIMTPEAKPFYAATYIPKHGRHGRPGLMELLPLITAKWQEDPGLLVKAADEVVAEMQKKTIYMQAEEKLDARVHEEAERALKHGFDQRFGGFGRAPKFPRPHDLSFLMNRFQISGDDRCLAMVEKTLLHMRCGGIYDHLGGGFHRYSTDEKWLVPHFEKMLYDQAGIVEAYLQAWQATGKDFYADTVRETLEYLCRDMSSPQGGFYSAEDADSEGEEGTFYLWAKAEIDALLGDQAGNFAAAYNIKTGGNYHDEVSGQLTGKNILYLSVIHADNHEQYARERKSLFDARSQRVRPHLDDKVIAAWNGMAMSAFARAGKALDDEAYVARASDVANFILQHMREGHARLFRCSRQDSAAIKAFSEDYAFVIRGLLDLYACDFDIKWLKSSILLADSLREFFQDSQSGRIFDTPIDGEELLVRPSSCFDGAAPAAASITLEVYGRLFLLTGDSGWRVAAEQLMRSLSSEVSRYPAGYTQLLLASNWILNSTREVVVVDSMNNSKGTEMLSAIKQANLLNTVVIYKTNENAADLSALAPFTNAMQPVDDHATAYVCQDFSCQRPVTNLEELMELLLS